MQTANNSFRYFIRKFLLAFIFIMPAVFMQTANAADKPGLANLRVEYITNPIGIDASKPRLSWEITADKRNFSQKAYQVQAAASENDLSGGKNLLWDSGEIKSEESNQIKYGGPELNSGQVVYWHVKIWGNDGSVSDWSKPAYWEMGLLKSSDWQAKWIETNVNEKADDYNPSPLLRKEFEIKKEVKSARAYITSHGLYEFHLNGKKVSDQLFTPGWTSYNKRLQYQVYDVTEYLASGKNAAGVILGDGWYRGPLTWDMKRNIYGNKLALLMQINIVYSDGTSEIFKSDDKWKSSAGPIIMSGIYDGEIYDARLEKSGWDNKGYDDKNWNGVSVNESTAETLVASEGPAVKVTQSIKPVKKFTTPNGNLVFDMGQNMVGWIKFELKGKTGEKITLRHAEVLDEEGNIYLANLRNAKQKIEYTFRSNDVESFEPHFTFQGFRYVEVTGYNGDIAPENLTGQVIHSDMAPAGNFECSDSMINQLQKNIQWGLRGNFLDIPTDCPQRDERLGWTGDAQAFAPTACFNMDAASFYTKWMKDFIADQVEDGRVPHVIPNIIGDNNSGAAGWADAAVIIPWTVYQNYGDTQILETQYNSIKAWIDYLKNNFSDKYLWDKNVGYGDWLAFATTNSDYPGATTDKDLIGTAYFYRSTSLLLQIAVILGKTEDAKIYETLAQNIKAAFQKEFITETGRVASNTQTAYVLALGFDLVPDNLKASAAKRLADDVDRFGHITTGFLGASKVCKILTDYGYNDQAFKLLFRKEYPGWLYPITKGATTIWERWDGIKRNGSFQDIGMNSFNHYAYGAVGKWLYGDVAGIDLDPQNPGYKKIIMKPLVPKELNFVKASYHSIYGDIRAEWKNENGKFVYEVQVPPNTTADVWLPAQDESAISESGTELDKLKDVKILKSADGKIIVNLGSGIYHFEVNK
jgi:alpha-L-rhamnosidase